MTEDVRIAAIEGVAVDDERVHVEGVAQGGGHAVDCIGGLKRRSTAVAKGQFSLGTDGHSAYLQGIAREMEGEPESGDEVLPGEVVRERHRAGAGRRYDERTPPDRSCVARVGDVGRR